MRRILILLLLVPAFQIDLAAQMSKEVDTKAAAIPAAHARSVESLGTYIKQNFQTEAERVRAIYVWIAEHISYDVARLQSMKNDPSYTPQPVTDVLASRKAVCQGYADLFITLCKTVDIPATLVVGYTKREGKVQPISHAWVAAVINGEWKLFDPTWGAGYVEQDRFVKSFNNHFFQTAPEDLIQDHMPFDPVYQFLSQPLTHKEFIEGGTKGVQLANFHYNDSLRRHLQLPPAEQMFAELRRLELSGVQNDLLFQRVQFLRKSLQAFASKDAFDEGGRAFQMAMGLFKDYIAHKNKQFSAIGDSELQQLIETIAEQIKISRTHLSAAEVKTDAQRQAKAGNIANLEKFWVQVTKEREFVQKFLETEKSVRRQLFTAR